LTQKLSEELEGEDEIIQSVVSELGGKVRLNRIIRFLERYDDYLNESIGDDQPDQPDQGDQGDQDDTDNSGDQPQEPKKERDLTMVYCILAGMVLTIAGDVAVYVLLKKKDRERAGR
jgi:hypothetical protein